MTSIPDGFRRNALGHLVPDDQIKPIDLVRDDLVQRLVAQTLEQQQRLALFKAEAMAEVESFVELSAEQYGVNLGGKKGNVTLTSFDGQYQVQLAQGERRHFDERIQAAKALIDECIAVWSEGASTEIKALVDHAFRVNKQGHIDVNQVLSLRQLNISHPKWEQAMEAIADSIQVGEKKAYLRIYRRSDDGRLNPIHLDIAKL